MSSSRNYRVIVADDDGQVGRRLTDFLKEKNFDAVQISNGDDLKKLLNNPDWVPHFVMADLVLPGCNALELCGLVKQIPHLSANDTKVMVMSAHNSLTNIKDSLKAGAADYVLKPFKFEDMIQRLIFHIQKKRIVPEPEREDAGRLQGGDLYMHLLEIVLKEATTPRKLSDTLFNLVKMLALTLKAVRCNIVMTSEDRLSGYIQASSDDRAATGIKIDLSRYPEIHHVMNTEKPVVIENLDSDPVLAEIKKSFKNVSFNSMMVCPLKKRGEFYGVMVARMDKSAGGFTDRDIRFAQLMAQIVSLTISSDLPLPLELRKPA